jgi:hypothetical protein
MTGQQVRFVSGRKIEYSRNFPNGSERACELKIRGTAVAFVPLSSILHERYFVYHEIQA